MITYQQNFKNVLQHFDLPSMQRLKTAFDNGKVVRCTTKNDDGEGCIMHFLGDFANYSELAKFSREYGQTNETALVHGLTVQNAPICLVISSWDYQWLTRDDAYDILCQEISRREIANKSEEDAVVLSQDYCAVKSALVEPCSI
jgi:hypothetical protein